MENEVDLSPGNPLDLTQRGPLALENLDTITPIKPQNSIDIVPNKGFGSIGGGILGTNRLNVKPNPEASDLDTAEGIATQRRNNLQKAASSPIGQFLFPDETRQWAKDAEDESIKINEIKSKRQMQQDVQAAARNRGLTRAVGLNATDNTLIEEGIREMKEGNYNAFKGLVGSGQGARAQLYMPEFIQALGKQTEAGQKAVQDLSKAKDQKEYNGIRDQILGKAKDEKHEYSASNLGLDENSIPKSKMEWEKVRGSATAKLNDASQIVEQFNQKQASLSQAIPITDEKVAASVTNNISGHTGEAFPNTQAVTLPGAGDAQGAEFKQPGSKDLANYGPNGTWNNGSSPELEGQAKQLNTEQFKGVLGKYKTAKDFYQVAMDDNNYKYSAGLAAINDKFGGVERNVAEGSRGAGTIGLTKQLEMQYGIPEHLANAVTKFRAEMRAWANGTGEMPKMSPQSIEGMKYVARATYNQDKGELDRLSLPAYTAGQRGIGLDKLGLDKEIQNDPYLKSTNEKGTMDYRMDVDKYPFIIKGDKRIALRQDAQVPGMIPAGAYAKTLQQTNERGTGENGIPAKGPPSTPVVPSSIAKNPVALTVFGAAGQTATNIGAGPNMARNVATVVTSAANSESTFNPNATHDGGIGYGLFGHNKDRLEAMQKFAGTKAGEPIAPDVQAKFFTRELAVAANEDAFIKETVNNPNASAADLTRVQIRLEKPEGYKGPGTEDKVPSWQNRLTNTQALMGGKTAEQNYYAAASQVPSKLANIAPAIGSTVGGIGGTVLGGPLGGAAGAIGGGAVGGAVRQAVLGGPGYVDQTIRGAAEGIPMAVPGIGPARIAARVAAGGAGAAGEKLYDSGGQDVAGAIESGTAGAVGGALGEAFGKALGMAGHKIYSHLAASSQAETMAAAKVLATQEPKVADATGKMVPNVAYDKAEQFVKDRGLDVEHAAYAYNVSKQGVPKGEALAQRPGAVEAAKTGKEYDAIREDVSVAGKGMAPKAQGPLSDGPVSTIQSATNPTGVPQKYARDAQHAEMAATAPAKSVDERWQRLGDARSKMLEKERDALSSTAADKSERADAMRTMADSIRVQQEKMAKVLLPKPKADALIARLETADKRYRNAMVASGDGDIVKAIAQGGVKGREAQAAFDALAAGDPAAKRMVQSLVAAQNSVGTRAGIAGALLPITYVLSHVPVVGTAAAAVTGTISAVKATQILRDYMVKRGAGAPVKFSNMIAREVTHEKLRRAGSAVGSSIGNQMAK